MQSSIQEFIQIISLISIGGFIGTSVASKVSPTKLPQTVAAFHSLVGFAAMITAIGEYLSNGVNMGLGELAATSAATLIGGITFTGSIVAFLKLNNTLSSSPLSLPGRDYINIAGLLMAVLLSLTLNGGDGVNNLLGVGIISSLLGIHLTASIGAADTPVVITVLNSYSGWALVAEGHC